MSYSVFWRISGGIFYESTNILVSKGVDRVEAPVVALVASLTTEGAAAGPPLASGGRGRGCRLSTLDHHADLHVRVRVRVRVVAQKVHQVLILGFVREEVPGDRAGRWLRRLRRGHPGFPLGRWWLRAEPGRWCGREVPGPARRVGWRDRCVDGSLPGGAGVPEVVLEKVPFTLQEGHLVVEHGDIPAEQGDLPVGLAWCPFGRRELVSAEWALLFPELLEAGLACDVAAFHDRGIGVGEVFQADATLRRFRLEGLEYQPADILVDRGHLVVRARR